MIGLFQFYTSPRKIPELKSLAPEDRDRVWRAHEKKVTTVKRVLVYGILSALVSSLGYWIGGFIGLLTAAVISGIIFYHLQVLEFRANIRKTLEAPESESGGKLHQKI